MNLYLDLDAVLLDKADPATRRVGLAPYARRFLEFALANFDVFWLSTHCKGDAQPVLDYPRPLVPDDLMPLLSAPA